MSGSVGTMRAGSSRHNGPKHKITKNEKSASEQQQQQQPTSKIETNKIQPTQDQIRLAQMMNSSTFDANPDTVKEVSRFIHYQSNGTWALTHMTADLIFFYANDSKL